MRTKKMLASAIFAAGMIVTGTSLQAETVAKYNFNGRTAKGTTTKRMSSAADPYNGEDYTPDREAGECGPVLENPGPGGQRTCYRSSFSNNSGEETKGREVLFLDCKHPWRLDYYKSKGEGVLPANGSFTWEIAVRTDIFDGTNRHGVLIDATKGEVWVPGYKPEADTLTTRLWLARKRADYDKKQQEKGDLFDLNFSVPTDTNNKVVTISTELKLGEWYNIAAVYNDVEHKMSLYVNGELKASADVISAPDRGTGFGIVGYSPDVTLVKHPIRLLKGYIDEIAFSNEALTPEKFVIPAQTKKTE